MTALRREDVPPEMQAWIDEQMKHFTPADLEPAVRLMRQYARKSRAQNREAAA
ncbi:hypothetical protein [Nocardia sp. NPDC058480]|uniref:hypothetical protein n=1 Tax=Nocardia sp. NPDC058480 TaxID=3346522 RepID=UPI00364EC4FC